MAKTVIDVKGSLYRDGKHAIMNDIDFNDIPSEELDYSFGKGELKIITYTTRAYEEAMRILNEIAEWLEEERLERLAYINN